MLFRMYTRWAERQGFKWETLDYEDGDEAGIKSATIMVSGENAYGYLRGENGVHRLVRISPSTPTPGARPPSPRWRSCARPARRRGSGNPPEDVEMQVYRSSGAGGQHINKTSSAVRLIHKPTGIVVSSQQQRSQFQNKDTCYRMLRDKLVQLQMQAHAEKISDLKGFR